METVTLVKTAQGRADTKLTTQMRRMIFLAFPMEDLAKGDSGLHIARYLKLLFSPPSRQTREQPFKAEGHYGEDGGVGNCLSEDSFSIACWR